MDPLAPVVPNAKSRRRFSPEFKAMVVAASDEPGQSVAGVARQYELNANLLHKWRQRHKVTGPTDFVRLPAPVTPVTGSTSAEKETIRIDLPGGIAVHWPLDRIRDSVFWLKALMP